MVTSQASFHRVPTVVPRVVRPGLPGEGQSPFIGTALELGLENSRWRGQLGMADLGSCQRVNIQEQARPYE